MIILEMYMYLRVVGVLRAEVFVRGRDEPFVMAGRDYSQSEDVEVLRSSREEARTVLDHQIQLLSEIHAKALRTIRITVLVLGVILSSTAFPETRQFVNWLTVAGVTSLVFAILSGLVAYTASNPNFGTSPDYLFDVRTTVTTKLHGWGHSSKDTRTGFVRWKN